MRMSATLGDAYGTDVERSTPRNHVRRAKGGGWGEGAFDYYLLSVLFTCTVWRRVNPRHSHCLADRPRHFPTAHGARICSRGYACACGEVRTCVAAIAAVVVARGVLIPPPGLQPGPPELRMCPRRAVTPICELRGPQHAEEWLSKSVGVVRTWVRPAAAFWQNWQIGADCANKTGTK